MSTELLTRYRTRPLLMPTVSVWQPNFSATDTHRLPIVVFGRRLDVTVSLAGDAAHHHQRQRIGRVDVAVAHAAAVGDERVVEHAAVAVGRRLQLAR